MSSSLNTFESIIALVIRIDNTLFCINFFFFNRNFGGLKFEVYLARFNVSIYGSASRSCKNAGIFYNLFLLQLFFRFYSKYFFIQKWEWSIVTTAILISNLALMRMITVFESFQAVPEFSVIIAAIKNNRVGNHLFCSSLLKIYRDQIMHTPI